MKDEGGPALPHSHKEKTQSMEPAVHMLVDQSLRLHDTADLQEPDTHDRRGELFAVITEMVLSCTFLRSLAKHGVERTLVYCLDYLYI